MTGLKVEEVNVHVQGVNTDIIRNENMEDNKNESEETQEQ